MGTQLVLTVGTNALPVWVAWHHLKGKLEPPVEVRFVYTAQTEDEMQRLKKRCTGANILPQLATSDGNPGTVRKDINGILQRIPDSTTLHVHYTGGTKVMAVEAVSAIEAQLRHRPNVSLQTSYLDPRGASGPTIVSRTRPLIADTRQGICPDLGLIADLNGFKLGPFTHKFGSRKTDDCPAAEEPQCEQLIAGEAWLNGGWEGPDGDGPRLLEYGACSAFRKALEDIAECNSVRNNFKLLRGVYVRRLRATDWDKHCELDVVGILGYQIVVVSCTVDGNQATIKQKGMEAILRARQLGGDEARAIVLCSATRNATGGIQKELHDEIGSATPPLEIWGKNDRGNLPNMQALSDKFKAYLRDDMKWS